MASSAICLDQNQNTISCSDPECTYGDCGSSSVQVTQGALCLDQNQNPVACADPECTYGDCAPNTGLGNIGAAMAGHADSGGTSLSTPSAGGATGGVSSSVLQTVSNLINASTRVITAPPKTSLTLGASGLNVSSSGSLFSNPLMLLLLAVIGVLLFGLLRKK